MAEAKKKSTEGAGMGFVVSKKALLAEMTLLSGIVERKATIPILSNVLIEAEDRKVKLTATDLDVSMVTSLPIEGLMSDSGSAVIDARKLLDIVKSLPDQEVTFEKESGPGDWVKISCGGSRFRIVGHAKEHYPATPTCDKPGVKFKADSLHSMINRTIYAITKEESRYALNGALLLVSGDTAELITTDGHRLAMAACKIEGLEADQTRLIIPRKGLAELLKLTAAAGNEGKIEFTKDTNQLFFKAGSRHLTCRMLTGAFPNYEQVIPKGNGKLVTLDVARISQGLKRAALMADDQTHGVKLEFGEWKVTLYEKLAMENAENVLIATVGLPRSGKSTWAKSQAYPIVNPDAIRFAIHGQAYLAGAEPFVWATAKAMVSALFLAGHKVVVLDATNNTRLRRDDWRNKQWKLVFKYFDTGAEECVERAIKAGDIHMEPVIRRMDFEHQPLAPDEERWP